MRKRSKFREYLAILLIVLLPSTALATNYFVKTTGSDSNNGTSTSTPFLTMGHCASVQTGGDTCIIFAGTYNENVTMLAGTGSGTYNVFQINGSDVVNVFSFTITSHDKLNGFQIGNAASPNTNPCVTIASGGQTDYVIVNNTMQSCGTYMIKEDAASNTTFGLISHNTLSYSCSTPASPNVCTAMQINGDHHLIINNNISHVSDGPYVFGQHNALINNTVGPTTDADCGTNSGNCHIDFMQADANVVGGAQPAAYLLLEGNTVQNMTVTGSFSGSGAHAGPLLQAEDCNGECSNAILRFHLAKHIYGGGSTNDNSGQTPPPAAWTNFKSYNNTWADMLIGFSNVGNGVNLHSHGSSGGANVNEIYYFTYNGACNQTNPYAFSDTSGTGATYGFDLADCTTGTVTLYGHTYGSGAFTADTGNISSDPKFVSYAGNNFQLQASSPALASGTSLTTVAAGDSGSGTSLVVTDAGFFQDGMGLTTALWGQFIYPDCIAVGTVTNTVCIAVNGINYSTNTITLANSINRSNGQPIWLYKDSQQVVRLTGSAPNIGAFGAGTSQASNTVSFTPGVSVTSGVTVVQ